MPGFSSTDQKALINNALSKITKQLHPAIFVTNDYKINKKSRSTKNGILKS